MSVGIVIASISNNCVRAGNSRAIKKMHLNQILSFPVDEFRVDIDGESNRGVPQRALSEPWRASVSGLR